MAMFKYRIAKIWFEKLASSFNENIDEAYKQKWVHLQGQILTKGKMRWNWSKLIDRHNKDSKKGNR